MAVTHKLYGPFLKNLTASTGILADGLASTATEISVRLMTSEHVFDQDHQYWSDVSTDEQSTSSTGTEDYTKGGQLLVGKALSYSTGVTTLTASSDVSFGSTVDVIGFFGVLTASSYLVSCIDFDGEEKSVGGVFKVTWTDNKVLTLEASA